MAEKIASTLRGSISPGKQRKFAAKAPLHLRHALLSVNLTKDLRKKHSTRNTSVVKGDTVKVLRGKFKKKSGKIQQVLLKRGRVYVEGVHTKKRDGSTSPVPLRPSNLQITHLNLSDKIRAKRLKTEAVPEKKTEKKETPKKDQVSKTTEAQA